jgi:exodeoxyribonuclease-1
MTFVFYDTETTGTDTSFDQIVQFGAIRTDDEMNELERFEVRCRLLPHVIPAPRALLTTGATPAILTDQSLPSHYEATCQIADKLESWSHATFIGYNSMQFDERLLRQAFYQNLKPIYLTNTNRNQRADIIKLVDAAITFEPGSIAVPLSDKGRSTRRLDAIAPANGFNHDRAHDALADVEATIYMAKLVRTRTPHLWDAMMATANKNAAIDVLEENPALALVECHYGRHNVTPVTLCGQNPEYGAQIGVFNLRHDPADFMDLSVEDIIAAMKAPRSPFHIVQANAQPIVIPLDRCTGGTIKELPSSVEIISRVEAIQRNRCFQIKVGDAIAGRYPEKDTSQFIEERIYDSFATTTDTHLAEMFHDVPWEARRSILNKMSDERFRDLGLRLLAIEANDYLSPNERSKFSTWLMSRRLGPAPKRTFRTIEQAISECLESLKCACGDEQGKLMEILSWLKAQST